MDRLEKEWFDLVRDPLLFFDVVELMEDIDQELAEIRLCDALRRLDMRHLR